mgnify:CR=1 FL=1
MKTDKESKKRFTMTVTTAQLKELRVVAALNDMTLREFVEGAIRNEILRIKKEK